MNKSLTFHHVQVVWSGWKKGVRRGQIASDFSFRIFERRGFFLLENFSSLCSGGTLLSCWSYIDESKSSSYFIQKNNEFHSCQYECQFFINFDGQVVQSLSWIYGQSARILVVSECTNTNWGTYCQHLLPGSLLACKCLPNTDSCCIFQVMAPLKIQSFIWINFRNSLYSGKVSLAKS